jgi:hypothetical protein
MSDRRIGPDDLGEFEGLPPDDPKLAELEGQPRVRAQLRAYRDFMQPSDLPDRAEMAEAEDRLKDALERELGVSLSGRPTGAASERAVAAAPGRGPGLFERLLGPRLRPVFAALAIVVVAGGAWLWNASRREAGEPVMRGGSPPAQGELQVESLPQELADGTLRLRWTPSTEATHYTVVFLSPALEELARVPGLTGPSLDLEPGALPPGLAPHSRVLWKVVAMRGADEVAHSPALPLQLP